VENEEGVLNELMEIQSSSFKEILNDLLDGDENLDLKTQIFKPKDLASLNVISVLLENMGFNKSSNLIMQFIEVYLRYMVSYKRLSRSEIIKAISNVAQEISESDSTSKIKK